MHDEFKKYVADQWVRLAATAWRCYRVEGRCCQFVTYEAPDKYSFDPVLRADLEVILLSLRLPDAEQQRILALVDDYDPQTEIVVFFGWGKNYLAWKAKSPTLPPPQALEVFGRMN
jgi:hypothetical protein